jgi:hypothetical protein
MNRYSTQNYKMLTRVTDFANKNAGLFNRSTVGAEIQTSLKAVVEEMAVLSSARISAEGLLRSARIEQEQARSLLRGRLMEGALTARALNNDKFRLARRVSDIELIEAGRAAAIQIASMKKEFSTSGESTEDVTPAVQALERAVLDYGTAKAKRTAAIQAFSEKMDVAMGLLRRLEALVAITLAGNTQAMTEWSAARTVGRITARKRVVEEPVEEPTVVEPPVVEPTKVA